MPVKPGDARREARRSVIPRRGIVWKAHRVCLRPRPDDEPACLGNGANRLAANDLKISKLCRQEGVIPTGHEQHGCLQRARTITTVDLDPVVITGGMVHPVVEEGRVAYGAVIRLVQRETMEATLQCKEGSWSCSPRLRAVQNSADSKENASPG